MRFGVDEAQARAFVARNAPKPEPVGVLAENWQAVEVFLALGQSWHYHPMGPRLGLLRSEMVPTLMLMGIRRGAWPDVFQRLRVIEQAAMEAAEA